MPFKMRCPNQHLLLVKDDLLGKALHCPVCHALVSPQEEPPPLAPDEVLTEFDWALSAEEAPSVPPEQLPAKDGPKEPLPVHKLPRKERRQRLRIVGLGLILLAAAMLLFLASALLWLMPVPVLAAPWLLLASLLCELAGTLLFFRVPPAAGARGTLAGALALALARIGLLALTVQLLPDWSGTWGLYALVGLDILVWMTHKVLLFWYLHLVADYIDAEGTAHDIRRLLHQAILLPACTVPWYLLAPWLASLPLWLGPLGMIVGFLTGVALAGWWGLYLVRYLALMFTLRRIIND